MMKKLRWKGSCSWGDCIYSGLLYMLHLGMWISVPESSRCSCPWFLWFSVSSVKWISYPYITHRTSYDLLGYWNNKHEKSQWGKRIILYSEQGLSNMWKTGSGVTCWKMKTGESTKYLFVSNTNFVYLVSCLSLKNNLWSYHQEF